MYLSEQNFFNVMNFTPLVSIDLLLKNKNDEYLLGRRVNQPAQNYWFVPGGRIQKSEKMNDAFNRLVKQELGLDYSISAAKFLGPWEHFYSENYFIRKI